MDTFKIKDIIKSTSNSVIVTIDIPLEKQKAYSFRQGQYIIMESDISGQKVRRSYSLCSSPLDNEWKVGIKKIENGLYSNFANKELKVGDTVRCLPPEGHFYTEINPAIERDIVCFAAGSGITPMLSIISTHLKSEQHTKIKLFYCNRTVSSIMLKEELESLKNEYLDRFEIFYLLTRQSRNIPMLDGRIDQSKLQLFVENGVLDLSNNAHYFSCGPEEMVLEINQFLAVGGVPKPNIHFELFFTSGTNKSENKKISQSRDGSTTKVVVIEGGKEISFDIEKGSDNILDAALRNNADLPYACKGGVCSTCKAKVIEGELEMLLSYGLEDDEKEKGYVLTCQTFPLSGKVVVDFDV